MHQQRLANASLNLTEAARLCPAGQRFKTANCTSCKPRSDKADPAKENFHADPRSSRGGRQSWGHVPPPRAQPGRGGEKRRGGRWGPHGETRFEPVCDGPTLSPVCYARLRIYTAPTLNNRAKRNGGRMSALRVGWGQPAPTHSPGLWRVRGEEVLFHAVGQAGGT